MIKKMETRMLMREQRLRKKLDRARDGGVCWEQTGIDYLFIDEAHEHKNLDTRSNNQELDIDGSGRASDLEMKLDYLRTTHGRRVVTFATATPIANSMTEAYVMCRYLRPDLLADAGIEDFDAWTGTFAETTTDVEVAPEGGIRVKDRFARFRNVPELLNMLAGRRRRQDQGRPQAPGPRAGRRQTRGGPRRAAEQLLEIHAHAGQPRRGRAQPRGPARRKTNMLKISTTAGWPRWTRAWPGWPHRRPANSTSLRRTSPDRARAPRRHLLRRRREPDARHGQSPDRLLRPGHPRRQEPLERL